MRRSTKRNLLVLISDPFKGLYQDGGDGIMRGEAGTVLNALNLRLDN